MPNRTLRLTEQEHEQLQTWAAESGRSVQREITFRLFEGLGEEGGHGTQGDPAAPPQHHEKGLKHSPSSPSTPDHGTSSVLDPGTPGEAPAEGNDAGLVAPVLDPQDGEASPLDPPSLSCGFQNRHHMYGPSNPCPRCGHPNA